MSVFVGDILCAEIFAHKAVFAVSDEIVPVCFVKRLAHGVGVIRHEVLQKRALHGFFLRVGGNIDLFKSIWVKPGVEHTGGNRSRRGVKILYLLRAEAVFFEELRHGDSVLYSAARVGGHKVRHKVLFFFWRSG